MRVAAYQAPLLPSGSLASLDLIRQRVNWCESEGIEILCCPEAILGGLADYAPDPARFAIDVDGGQLDALLKPLASHAVTTIVGFTEIRHGGQLYNSAAVYHKGAVLGIYRKLYPAINRSVYRAGAEIPTFRVGDLRFGIVICLDSNYVEPARIMAAAGATAIFVPTNSGLPHDRASADLPTLARNTDIARAIDNSVFLIRADVAGRSQGLLSYGSSEIVGPDGVVRQSARRLSEDLIVADVDTSPRHKWDAASNPAVMDAYARLVAQRRGTAR